MRKPEKRFHVHVPRSCEIRICGCKSGGRSVDSEAVLSGDREASHGHSLLSMIGAVIIGRNEGKNLGRCLTSLRGCRTVVYVDSGSTDGSTAIAAGLGADVVELDMRI